MLRCRHSPHDIEFAVSTNLPTIGLYENSYQMFEPTPNPSLLKLTDPITYEKAKLVARLKLKSADYLLPQIGQLPQLIKSNFKAN